jgi:hypothetical protein
MRILMDKNENQDPTPVWTPADAVDTFRAVEDLLHNAVGQAAVMSHRAAERDDMRAASLFDARSAVLFRAAMVAAAMCQDALHEAAALDRSKADASA